MKYEKYDVNGEPDFKYEIGRLADWLLTNGYDPMNDNEGAVDRAIRTIREHDQDSIYHIYNKRFKHCND